jgi:hypothetical protein
MAEIWLQANRRIVLLPTILFAVVAAACTPIYLSTRSEYVGAAAILAADAALVWWLIFRRPRISFDGRNVRLNVRNGRAVRVPVELVEAFMLGKGPAFLDGRDDYRTETSTLVVRIAERAEEFRKVETNVRVAAWCGHYCTLRGTWTEPLSVDLVNRLNQRLYDVQQAAKSPERVTT